MTMPNWCRNNISIRTTDTELLEEIYNHLVNGYLLNYLAPRPKDPLEGRYRWSVDNWGTKWDVSPETVEIKHYQKSLGSLEFDCETAWSPPIKALQTGAKNKDFAFTMEFEEPDMGIFGVATNKMKEVHTVPCLYELAERHPTYELAVEELTELVAGHIVYTFCLLERLENEFENKGTRHEI